jgi:Flp pilus assembly protein TadD
MMGCKSTHMQVNERVAGCLWAGCLCGILCLTSCATKTAALHSTPYFNTAPVITPVRETVNAVDAGDGDLEIAGLRSTMMAHPEDLDARLRLAQAYDARRFPEVALEHYRLAAEKFPDSLKAAVALARALRRADKTFEALTGLNAFIHAHPQQTAEAYEWQGILNDDLHDWKASQLAYETALLYAPDSAELHNNLGYTLLMQFQYNAAAIEFRSALRDKRDMVIARNNLGIALAASPDADHKEAILNWQAMSGPAAAHNNMAALLIERGDYPEARKELGAALGYDHQNAQAIYNLALVSERDGKPAVLPTQNTAAKTAKQGNLLTRFFLPWRYSGKQADAQPLTAGKTSGGTAEPIAAPTGSGSGN